MKKYDGVIITYYLIIDWRIDLYTYTIMQNYYEQILYKIL